MHFIPSHACTIYFDTRAKDVKLPDPFPDLCNKTFKLSGILAHFIVIVTNCHETDINNP